MGLEEVFGAEFTNRYAAKTRGHTKFIMNDKSKKEIIEQALTHITPDNLYINYIEGKSTYHVALISTSNDLKIKPMNYGMTSVTCRLGGDMMWLNVYDNEILESFEPENNYLIVGFQRLKPSNSDGKALRIFRVDAVITMDEMTAYKEQSNPVIKSKEVKIKDHEELL